MTPTVSYAEYLRTHRQKYLDELMALLRIPTISAWPDHKAQMHKAARWLAERLHRAGLHGATVLPTGGAPAVYAEWLGAPGQPTALVYGHYDVQPADPLDRWETPPFAPTIRDGKIYARGATDNKGQMYMHILAVEALLKTSGRLPANVKFFIEGEEEIGSPHLGELLQLHRGRLAADFCLISDSSLWQPGIPALIYGLRGLAAMEIRVKGAKGDLHSGAYGGTVQNGIHALVELLAGLRNHDGRISVPGFYDRVRQITAGERQTWQALNFDESAYKQKLGVAELHGEAGFSPLERVWARPTLELNGIGGGYQGTGMKTVLVSEARAKITCRLVPDQDPAQIYTLIEQHLQRIRPPGVTVICQPGHRHPPVLVPLELPAMQAAARGLTRAYGQEPVFIRSGSSIPAVGLMQSVLGLEAVLMGFGLATENSHAPNEHFHLENFDTGLQALGAFWYELSH